MRVFPDLIHKYEVDFYSICIFLNISLYEFKCHEFYLPVIVLMVIGRDPIDQQHVWVDLAGYLRKISHNDKLGLYRDIISVAHLQDHL
jgi:hypothetical protein